MKASGKLQGTRGLSPRQAASRGCDTIQVHQHEPCGTRQASASCSNERARRATEYQQVCMAFSVVTEGQCKVIALGRPPRFTTAPERRPYRLAACNASSASPNCPEPLPPCRTRGTWRRTLSTSTGEVWAHDPGLFRALPRTPLRSISRFMPRDP